MRGAEIVRLAEVSEVPVEADHVTLSHCWGNICIFGRSAVDGPEIISVLTETKVVSLSFTSKTPDHPFR
jgi:hypothetical protein